MNLLWEKRADYENFDNFNENTIKLRLNVGYIFAEWLFLKIWS